jgi:hypothetical protein
MPQQTINLAPTWIGILPALLNMTAMGGEIAQTARVELERAMRSLDTMNGGLCIMPIEIDDAIDRTDFDNLGELTPDQRAAARDLFRMYMRAEIGAHTARLARCARREACENIKH